MPLAHDRRGKGPLVLLLHGIGSHKEIWDPLVDRLVLGGRETLAVDMPGFGRSPTLPPGVRPDAEALARAVIDFLDESGLGGPVHVAGNSLGGWVALEIARLGRAQHGA